jgi:hypothetical protein
VSNATGAAPDPVVIDRAHVHACGGCACVERNRRIRPQGAPNYRCRCHHHGMRAYIPVKAVYMILAHRLEVVDKHLVEADRSGHAP